MRCGAVPLYLSCTAPSPAPPEHLAPDQACTETQYQLRRELHKTPELAFEEFRTSAYIRAQLKDLKIPFQTFESPAGARTGLVATLGAGEPKIVLRADIDALPIRVR